jgi:hypothetical protein
MIWKLALIVLFIESIRKYFFNSVYLLLTLDLFLILFFILYGIINKKFAYVFSIVFLASLFLSVVNAVLHKEIPLYIFAQFREFLPFIAGWAIGSSFRFKIFIKDLNILSLILVCISVFAVLQIYSTPTGFLNYIPASQVMGSSGGFGGYAKEVEELYGGTLFRPSLVFMVTGKYGTFVAAITIFVTSLLLIFNIRGFRFFIYISILLIANIVAMQRAFFYPYIFFLVALVVYRLFNGRKNKFYIFTSLFLILFTILFSNNNPIYDRFLTFPVEIFQRFTDLGLLGTLFSSEIIYFGRGPGYFSNYSQALGGGFFSDYFGGEGGWHMLVANYGLILPIILLLWILYSFINTWKTFPKNQRTIECMSFSTFIGFILILWGYTHNIYASSYFIFVSIISIAILVRDCHNTLNEESR